MRTAQGVLCVTVFAAALASATPCSPGGTLSSYIALGSAGCTVGNTLFNDFASLTIPLGATQISPSSVTVTPQAGPLDQTLVFNVGASVDDGDFSDIDIGFEAAPVGRLVGSQVSLIGASFTADGAVTAIHDACPNGTFDVNLNCSTTDFNAIVTDTAGFTDLTEGTSFSPALKAAFSTDIGVDPGLSGTASLRSASVTVDTVPEPAQLGLFTGAGLVALSFLRTRRPGRK